MKSQGLTEIGLAKDANLGGVASAAFPRNSKITPATLANFNLDNFRRKIRNKYQEPCNTRNE
jgi:hypothetical protein